MLAVPRVEFELLTSLVYLVTLSDKYLLVTSCRLASPFIVLTH